MDKLIPHQNYADVVIIGNGSASAGAVYEFNQHLKKNPKSDLTVLVLEAQTEEDSAVQMPEYNARVTFPYDMKKQIDGIEDTIINTYDRIAFYCPDPDSAVCKNLPEHEKDKKNTTSLVDVTKLIELLEKDLHPNIKVRQHKQVYNAEYVKDQGKERIRLEVQYPFKDEKVLENTDIIYTKAVIDGSGTGSVMLDCMQGYRKDSDVVCGVQGCKLIRLDDFVSEEEEWSPWDPKLVSLGLDDKMTHGAGVWDYRNDKVSPELAEFIKKWLRDTKNERIKKILGSRRKDKKLIKSLEGRISDVGISSISTYAQAQHYTLNLQRQAEAVFTRLPGYKKRFSGAAVIPGSLFYKPSPVLQPVSQMAGRRYLLVGDAAGHATPYIGEGIRPGIDMGVTAAEILLESLTKTSDFSEKTLRTKLEDEWYRMYGKYDLYSDLFRHFSSTCFSDKQWNTFFKRINEKLSDKEFFEVLKSQYTQDIAWKMFDYRMITHYVRYRIKTTLDFLFNKTNRRQAVSWIK